MKRKSLTRVLALDLHPRRFGYAVLESPDRLLGWGVCTDHRKRKSGYVLIRKRLKRVLESWNPTVILLQHPAGRARRPSPERERSLKGILTEAKHRRIPVREIKTKGAEIHGKRITRFESARRVAERFPVLKWKLPPKRSAWESEDYRMSMLAAAHLAYMYQRNFPLAPS